jgi:hypothetical protein
MRAPQHYTVGPQQISDALIGYTKLDAQTKALGISRSTAWTIAKTKNKLGRLSTKTTNCILANPELPPSVRAVIHQYLTESAFPGECRKRRLEPFSFSRAQAASGY